MRNGLRIYEVLQVLKLPPAQRNLALNENNTQLAISAFSTVRQIIVITLYCFVNDPATTVLDGVTVADGNANGTGNINVEPLRWHAISAVASL